VTAASLVAEHDLTKLGLPYDLLVSVIAVGWLEGWQAGGDEAKAILSDALARYARGGLHSVPS